MALLITSKTPTAHGFDIENLYLMIDAQYTVTTKNHLEMACVAYASQQARNEGKEPIKIGNHPLAALTNSMRFKLIDKLQEVTLPEAINVQNGLQIFQVVGAVYYNIVKQAIVEMNKELPENLKITYEDVI
jgi:hypothetical protein